MFYLKNENVRKYSGSDKIHCHLPFPPSNTDFILSFHVFINVMILLKILFPDHRKIPITAKVIAMSGVVRPCVVISSHVTRALVEL